MKSTSLTLLRQIAGQLQPANFISYRDFLQEVFDRAKAELESYSYLLFAEDLGFPKSNALHLILRGKRRLTTQGAAKVIAALELKHVERQYFEALIAANNAKNPADKSRLISKLEELKARTLDSKSDQDQLEYFARWYHPVVREMLSMKDAPTDPHEISSRIVPRVTPQEVKDSLKLLKKLKMITWDKDKAKYLLPVSDVTSSEDVQSLGVFLYLKSVSDLATEALMKLPEKRRDISAVTICASEETLLKIKKEVADFHERLLELSRGDSKKDQVYQVNVHVFPFTKN